MADQERFQATTNRVLRCALELSGVQYALDAISANETERIPGIVLAKALVGAVLAKHRVELSNELFREVSRSGRSAHDYSAIGLDIQDGKVFVVCTRVDLADMMEGE